MLTHVQMKRAALLLTDSTASCIVMGRVVYGEKDAIPKPKSTLKTCQTISALILQNRNETTCSNWAQSTDRQAKTLDSHALVIAEHMVAMSRSRQELKYYKNMGEKYNVPFEKQKLDAVSRDTVV
uniref:Uncharacterized protein n=1 Tax=Rhodnius prolixus TaxID=13249 RepID=T1I4S4_RHOPR